MQPNDDAVFDASRGETSDMSGLSPRTRSDTPNGSFYDSLQDDAPFQSDDGYMPKSILSDRPRQPGSRKGVIISFNPAGLKGHDDGMFEASRGESMSEGAPLKHRESDLDSPSSGFDEKRPEALDESPIDTGDEARSPRPSMVTFDQDALAAKRRDGRLMDEPASSELLMDGGDYFDDDDLSLTCCKATQTPPFVEFPLVGTAKPISEPMVTISPDRSTSEFCPPIERSISGLSAIAADKATEAAFQQMRDKSVMFAFFLDGTGGSIRLMYNVRKLNDAFARWKARYRMRRPAHPIEDARSAMVAMKQELASLRPRVTRVEVTRTVQSPSRIQKLKEMAEKHDLLKRIERQRAMNNSLTGRIGQLRNETGSLSTISPSVADLIASQSPREPEEETLSPFAKFRSRQGK